MPHLQGGRLKPASGRNGGDTRGNEGCCWKLSAEYFHVFTTGKQTAKSFSFPKTAHTHTKYQKQGEQKRKTSFDHDTDDMCLRQG